MGSGGARVCKCDAAGRRQTQLRISAECRAECGAEDVREKQRRLSHFSPSLPRLHKLFVSCQVPQARARPASPFLSLPTPKPLLPGQTRLRPLHACAVAPHGRPVSRAVTSPETGALFSPLFPLPFPPAHEPHLRGSCSLRPRSTPAPAAAAWDLSALRRHLQLLWRRRELFPLPVAWGSHGAAPPRRRGRPRPQAAHVPASPSSRGRACGWWGRGLR